jgi:hypothetical protein
MYKDMARRNTFVKIKNASKYYWAMRANFSVAVLTITGMRR